MALHGFKPASPEEISYRGATFSDGPLLPLEIRKQKSTIKPNNLYYELCILVREMKSWGM